MGDSNTDCGVHGEHGGEPIKRSYGRINPTERSLGWLRCAGEWIVFRSQRKGELVERGRESGERGGEIAVDSGGEELKEVRERCIVDGRSVSRRRRGGRRRRRY